VPRLPADPTSYTVRHLRVPTALDHRVAALADAEERTITQMMLVLLRYATASYQPRPPAPPPSKRLDKPRRAR
jgi:hypothetical protein